MKEQLDSLRQEVEGELKQAGTLKELDAVKVRYLGKKGPIQDLMKVLRDASPEERPQLGQAINALKVSLEELCASLEEQLLASEESARLAAETLDITLPGHQGRPRGAHPVSQMMEELLTIHRELGFSVQYGPDIETDYYNFEALNFGPDHPARDMHDTFYLVPPPQSIETLSAADLPDASLRCFDDEHIASIARLASGGRAFSTSQDSMGAAPAPHILLRTHTSNTQVRVMEKHTPPIRIATPGRTYRNEDITPRAHIYFHQVDGLYIDTDVTFADLLQTLETLLKSLFGPAVVTRFRPSYFPFVEPGLEVDVAYGDSGWLEVLGAGMVHPEVLKSGGIDPDKYTGYAWGIGVERLFLLKHGVTDIRLLAENRLDFLEQFR